MAVSVNDLKVHIALSVVSKLGWSNDAKAGELVFFMERSHWPLLAYTAVKYYGFPVTRFSEDERDVYEEYVAMREPGSSRSEPQGTH